MDADGDAGIHWTGARACRDWSITIPQSSLVSRPVVKIPYTLPGNRDRPARRSTERLLELLNTGQLDLTIIQIMDDSWPLELTTSSVGTQRLLTEELVLVVAPNHALAHHQHVTMEELRDEPFVLFKPGSGLRHTVIQRSLAAGFTPRILFESGELSTIRSLVAEGLGISVLPRSVAEAPGREVVIVSLGPPPPV